MRSDSSKHEQGDNYLIDSVDRVEGSSSQELPPEANTAIRDMLPLVIQKDTSGKYSGMNRVAAAEFRVEADSDRWHGTDDHDYFEDSIAHTARAIEEEVLERGMVDYDRLERRTWAGSDDPNWMLVTRVPNTDSDGRRTGITIILRKLPNSIIASDFLGARALQTSALSPNNLEICRRAVVGANDGMWERDLDTDRLTVNARWWKSIGYENDLSMPQDLTFADFLELIHTDDRDLVCSTLHNHIEGRTDEYQCEFRVVNEKGDISWIRSRGTVTKSNNKPKYISGSHTNITILKTVQAQLAEGERFLRSVVNTSRSLIFVKDASRKFTFVNEALAEFFGTTPQEAEGRTDADFCATPAQQQSFERTDRLILEGLQHDIVIEEAIRDSNQRDRWFRTRKIAFTVGDETHVMGVATEISDLVEERNRREHKHKELQSVMDLAPTAIYMKDCQRRYTEVNPAMLRKANVSNADELIGRTADEVFSERVANEIRRCDIEVLEGGEQTNEETVVDYPDGRRLTYRGSKVPRRDERGMIVGIVGSCLNVTKELEAAEERAKLVRLQTMDTLIVSLKHDMLYVLLGMLRSEISVIPECDPVDPATQRDWVQMIELLQRYIETLQWWVPRDEGNEPRMRLGQIQAVQLRELVDQVARWADRFIDKPRCHNVIPEGFVVNCDRVMLLLLVYNLLQNAKRYTPDEKVEEPIVVTAEYDPALDMVQIAVDDAGYGLPPKEIDVMGMGQHYNPPGCSISGTGFGLYLCSKIATAHGGSMNLPVESSRGGCVFSFHIPARP